MARKSSSSSARRKPQTLSSLISPLRRGKKRRNATSSGKRFQVENLEDRRLMAVTTFQNGVNNYNGTQDTVLYSISPDVNFGTETAISPDQQDANGVRQGLMRFDEIFGIGSGQIPLGSTINSATLQVNVVNPSVSAMQMSLYRMTHPWTETTATWNSFGEIGGVQASEGEATDLPPDAVLFDPQTGVSTFDVTLSLQNWSAGQENLGWLIESAATDGWDFETSEAGQTDRPKLTVNYTPPSGAGKIELLNDAPRIGEGDAGTTTASIVVSRLGGVSGEVTVQYDVAAGTAQSDDFTASTGTLTFAPGQTTATIEVAIAGDETLEGNESIVVTLSAPTGGATL
ncbi:MAG: DNRLRE domain-containing protein, partial [Planctomycetales bacterium]|nr:DNRLRE domain-containing protein [Planctomycetales bacterium]